MFSDPYFQSLLPGVSGKVNIGVLVDLITLTFMRITILDAQPREGWICQTTTFDVIMTTLLHDLSHYLPYHGLISLSICLLYSLTTKTNK